MSMSFVKVRIPTFLVAITLWQNVYAQSLKGKIQIDVSADTNVFVWGESIWLYVTIHNLLGEEVRIPNPKQQLNYVRLALIDQDGKTFETGIIPFVIGTTYASVPPNGKLEEPYSLATYGNDQSLDNPSSTQLLPAVYKAKASLEDVSSTEFSFRVIPATDEQRIVAKEIVEKIKLRPKAQKIRNAESLLRRYPKTIYLPNIYFQLLTYLDISENPDDRSDRLIRYSLEYLEKFPNRGDVQMTIYFLINGWRNKLGIRRDEKFTAQQWRIIEGELEKIKSRFPNERMKRYVEKMIKNNKPQ